MYGNTLVCVCLHTKLIKCCGKKKVRKRLLIKRDEPTVCTYVQKVHHDNLPGTVSRDFLPIFCRETLYGP
jgi:hypothetical protein